MADKPIAPQDQLKLAAEAISTQVGTALLTQGRDMAYTAAVRLENTGPGRTEFRVAHADGSTDAGTFTEASKGFSNGGKRRTQDAVYLLDKHNNMIDSTITTTQKHAADPDTQVSRELRGMDGELVAREQGKCSSNSDGSSTCFMNITNANGDAVGTSTRTTKVSPDKLAMEFTNVYKDALGRPLGTVHETLKVDPETQTGIVIVGVTH